MKDGRIHKNERARTPAGSSARNLEPVT
jgi:hypothetical protein